MRLTTMVTTFSFPPSYDRFFWRFFCSLSRFFSIFSAAFGCIKGTDSHLDGGQMGYEKEG